MKCFFCISQLKVLIKSVSLGLRNGAHRAWGDEPLYLLFQFKRTLELIWRIDIPRNEHTNSNLSFSCMESIQPGHSIIIALISPESFVVQSKLSRETIFFFETWRIISWNMHAENPSFTSNTIGISRHFWLMITGQWFLKSDQSVKNPSSNCPSSSTIGNPLLHHNI